MTILVKDTRLLRSLERQGFITEPEEMFRPYRWKGDVKVYYKWGSYGYVNETKEGNGPHLVQVGRDMVKFVIRYVDGCFFPFVFELERTPVDA